MPPSDCGPPRPRAVVARSNPLRFRPVPHPLKPTGPLSRRSFLQTSAAGLGALALPQILPSRVYGAAHRKLNVAVIGCGNRSRQLIPSILQE